MKHFYKGNLTLYCPFDPDWIDTKDDGFLSHPISSSKGTFETNNEFKEQILALEMVGFYIMDPFAQPLRS